MSVCLLDDIRALNHDVCFDKHRNGNSVTVQFHAAQYLLISSEMSVKQEMNVKNCNRENIEKRLMLALFGKCLLI